MYVYICITLYVVWVTIKYVYETTIKVLCINLYVFMYE